MAEGPSENPDDNGAAAENPAATGEQIAQAQKSPEDIHGEQAQKRTEFIEEQQLPRALNLSETDKKKLNEAFGREMTLTEIAAVTTYELAEVEEKTPGVTALLYSLKIDQVDGKAKEMELTTEELGEKSRETYAQGKEFTFDSRGNEEVEMRVGLADLLPEQVRTVTILIHPKNIYTGGNREIYQDDKEAQRVFSQWQKNGTVEYLKRTSTIRTGVKGDFHDKNGYLRVFTGDTYVVREVYTPEQMAEYKKNLEANREKDRRALSEIYGEEEGFYLDEDVLERGKKHEDVIGRNKNITEYKERHPDWDTAMEEAMQRYGIARTAINKGIIYSMIQLESGGNPNAKNKKSSAYGLGQFLNKTAGKYYKSMKNQYGTEMPDYATFRTDPVWQMRAMVKFQANSARSLGKLGIHPFSNPTRENIAFLYLMHHDGPGGVNIFLRLWKQRGFPQGEGVPKFSPSERELHDQFAVADFQRARGIRGTNKMIDIAHRVADRAMRYGRELAG